MKTNQNKYSGTSWKQSYEGNSYFQGIALKKSEKPHIKWLCDVTNNRNTQWISSLTPPEDEQDQQTHGPNYQKTGHRWIELGMNREIL